MPTRRREALQRRLLRGGLVEVVGLRIKLRSEALDVFARNQLFPALDAHAQRKIFEPLDHGLPFIRSKRSMSYRPARLRPFTARLTTFCGHWPVSTRRTSPGAPA